MKIGDVFIDSKGLRVKAVKESFHCEGCMYNYSRCDPVAVAYINCANHGVIFANADGESTEVEQLRAALGEIQAIADKIALITDCPIIMKHIVQIKQWCDK
jgi:hypothetical protein